MSRKLVAALACRNQGTRLYGKPMQNLDIEKNLTVLDYIIDWLKQEKTIDAIVLGIAEGVDNLCFVEKAAEHKISYIIGDEEDVLDRLIASGEKEGATDIFRLTTESPFTYFDAIPEAWKSHVKGGYDMSVLDFIPDGSGFEITTMEAYKRSHREGDDKHRSELCSLYIRENKKNFKLNSLDAPKSIKRTDIRLTIDYPEDLVLCRDVYKHFKDLAPRIPLLEIIEYLDSNPSLKQLVEQFVEEGLKTMYV